MINPSVLARAPDIRAQFQRATPFKHVAIDDFLDVQTCESLLRDFPAFDERHATDELGRIGRKAVVERVSGISPAYRAFYEYINSASFLQSMSDLTGIPALIADATLFGGGTHENRDGQGLDVHVDFNVDERRMLHRRLNLLVYLNREWEDAWGGTIELHSDPRHPEIDEVKRFLPLFNRALVFETNEYSWHGFRRIDLPPDKKHLSRKSFSIYLYTTDRPAEEVVAPHTTFYVAQPLPARFCAGYTLDEADARDLHALMASRDGLVEMYQRLLIEKERRLHRLLAARRSDGTDVEILLSSRSWKVLMAVQRLRYHVRRLLAP
ncbi:MAG: 2OG-Fe(II) oxygenase [Rudaea sp.]